MHRCLISLIAWLLLAAVLLPTATAEAQVGEISHRLKKLYDFEDTDDRGNKIGISGRILPRNWYVIGRPAIGENQKFHQIPLHQSLESRAGYPHFSDVAFDSEHAYSGDFALRLGLTGGQTGAFVQHAAIHATAGSDYRVTARVRTQDLDHAWAELRAYFVDNAGNRIPGSLHTSDPIQSGGEWVSVSVVLPGEFNQANYIGIELHVVQPKRDADDPIGDHQVVPADITGGAWFDDIAVWEMPSIKLTTGVKTNIINAPAQPVLRASVRDLTGQRMRAAVRVYDHRHQLVDMIEDDIDKNALAWTPNLRGRFGWYIAELSIYELDLNNQITGQIARTLTAFLWLPEYTHAGGNDLARFTVVAEDVATKTLPDLAELMEQAGLTGLVLSAWERGDTAQTTALRAHIIEPIVRDLMIRRGRVTVSLWPVPVELAGRIGVDASDPLNVLTKPADDWLDYAKPFLAPLGQRLTTWQVGSTSRPLAFLARDLSADIESARVGIRAAAPSPRLIAPWQLDQASRSAELPPSDAYAIAWPQGVTPDRLADAMTGWPTPPTNARLDIQLADASDMSQPRRVADLMLRALHAWEVQPGSIGLNKPWAQSLGRDRVLMPDPALGVWVTLARQLDGQRVIGRMPLGQGLRAMILDGKQGGMLAVWNESADQDPTELTLYLGEAPVAVDPFGNTTPLIASGGRHRLSVGRTPTIIRGIDPRVALFRAGFTLDDPFIESLQVAHRRVLRIHNPWPRTLNGQYMITGPDGWTIQPQIRHVSIAPGDTLEIPIAIRFPIHEDGGNKTLTADVMFTAGEDYDVTLYAPMELGLKGVEFDATAIFEPGEAPGTTDAVVTLTVTNTAENRQSLNIFAGLQGHPRRELILPGIEPGEFVSRRIRFKDIDAQVGRFPLRCGVRESNGPAVLNKIIELEQPRQRQRDPVVGVETP